VGRLRGQGGPAIPRQPQDSQPQALPQPPAPGWSPDAAANKIGAEPPADEKKDATAEAVIDLVGGVLSEVAKRRAERQAAEGAQPEQAPPARRGRLLRRLMQPQAPSPVAPPAPAATPTLEPVPQAAPQPATGS
jgi:hypothetical protein